MADRDHDPRHSGASHASTDDSYAAATPATRRRNNSTSPTTPLKSEAEPNHYINDVSRHSRNIMSFLSRFGSKNKAKLKPEQSRQTVYRAAQSAPSTPRVAAPPKNAVPVHEPLPEPTNKVLSQFPLCVAYVQAIKRSVLPACTHASEKILHQENGRNSSRRGMVIIHRHQANQSADLSWTKKLFVLVPGKILQYSADGSDDRLPEKLLQLTASSLAYATDAIPGRPWVLQVYAAAGQDGNPMPQRRNTFITKVTFWGGWRNSISSLLMVFESGDDMNSWMGIIRAEAAKLGSTEKAKEESGPKATESPEIVIEATKDEPEDDTQFSRHSVISRDSLRPSNEEAISRRSSTQYRSSLDADRSTISQEQITLDQLRGSRLSLHGGGDPTRIMTISPDTSPERYSSLSSASYKRRSVAQSMHSHSSVELRHAPAAPKSQHPLSIIGKDGNLYWMPRTPSPTNANVLSSPAITPELHVPNRIHPTNPSLPPVTPHPLLSRPSVPNLPTVDRTLLVPGGPMRPLSSHNSSSSSTKAVPTPIPTSKLRPASMFVFPQTQQQAPGPVSLSLPTTSPLSLAARRSATSLAPLNIQSASPGGLKRRSLCAVTHTGERESSLAQGAPRHPPPNIPLPKVPSPVDELPLPVPHRGSGSRRGAGGGGTNRRKSSRRSSKSETSPVSLTFVDFRSRELESGLVEAT